MSHEEESPPPEECPAMRVIAMPKEANANGDIFGGWIMAQIDLAGSIAAGERARGRIVTVAIEGAHFRKPVYIGDVVSFYCRIAKTGRTSLSIEVTAFAMRTSGEMAKVATATMIYVAIDHGGKPRPLPAEG